MAITHIDFHIDDHVVQVGDGMVRIFLNGSTDRKPIEFEATEIIRLIKAGAQQLDDGNDYGIG